MYDHPQLGNLVTPDPPESEESNASSDSDDSDDSDDTVQLSKLRRPEPPREYFYSCESCYTEREENYVWVNCAFCLDRTGTVMRACDSGEVLEWHHIGSSWRDVGIGYTGMECYECHNPTLVLGGNDVNDRLFDTYCYHCGESMPVMYSDETISYSCAECRQERDAPAERWSDSIQDTMAFWEDHCDWCGETTNTVRIESGGQEEHYCCPECRAERQHPSCALSSKFQWCRHCEELAKDEDIDFCLEK